MKTTISEIKIELDGINGRFDIAENSEHEGCLQKGKKTGKNNEQISELWEDPTQKM